MYPQNIKVTVDAVVLNRHGGELRILLVRRKHNPYEGMWALPGGFVEDDEDLDTAAMRELEEETGLKLQAMKQLYTVATPGRDPRGRTLTVVYYATINEPNPPVAGADDAAEAAWVAVAELKEMAFDHMEIVRYAVGKVKG